MSVAYPLLNGIRHSYASAEFRFNGQFFLGIQELNYSPKLDPGEVYGAGAMPIGYTLGKASFEGDVSILLEEFNTFVTALGPNYMTKTFDIVIAYSTAGLTTIVDELQGCRITSIDTSGVTAGSTDAIVRKCSLKMLNIITNGIAAGPDVPSPTA